MNKPPFDPATFTPTQQDQVWADAAMSMDMLDPWTSGITSTTSSNPASGAAAHIYQNIPETDRTPSRPSVEASNIWKREEPKSPIQAETGCLTCPIHDPLHSTNKSSHTTKTVSQAGSIVNPPAANKSQHVTVSGEIDFFH